MRSSSSPSWHALWQFKVSESVGKPTSILNGKGADIVASTVVVADFFRDGCSKARCTNTMKDGSLVSHDLELTPVKDGILGTSRNIVLLKKTFGFGARDAEVFGEDGLSTPLPIPPPAARAPSGRDWEYFDYMPEVATGTRVGTVRLGARDIEVFGEHGLSEPLPAPPPAARRLSGRDMEYFYDALPAPKSFGARDAEVFGVDGLTVPLPAPPQPMGRLSARDVENYFDDGLPVTDKATPNAAVPKPAFLGARDVEVFGLSGLSAPLPTLPPTARVRSARDMEF